MRTMNTVTPINTVRLKTDTVAAIITTSEFVVDKFLQYSERSTNPSFGRDEYEDPHVDTISREVFEI